MEPSSTLVFKVLILIFATTTKICPRAHFIQAHAKSFTMTPTSSYSSELCYWLWRLSIGTTLECHPFSGLVCSQVCCYTFISGIRLPWPLSYCLGQPTLFMGSDEHRFRHLNLALRSSRIVSSAYQKWPTKNSHSVPYFNWARRASNQFNVWV